MERAPRCAWFQPSGVPQKRRTKSCACSLCLPRQRCSGSQELEGHTLPGTARRLPSTSPAPVPACAGRVPVACVSRRLSRWMWTIQNLRRSLIRNWRPVCSVVGDSVLVAEPALFPSPLPQAGLGRSTAVSSSLDLLRPFLLQMAGSVFGPVNYLSPSCYYTV